MEALVTSLLVLLPVPKSEDQNPLPPEAAVADQTVTPRSVSTSRNTKVTLLTDDPPER